MTARRKATRKVLAPIVACVLFIGGLATGVRAENPVTVSVPLVIGFEEQVAVGATRPGGGIAGPVLAARIDTGAATSSIDARGVVIAGARGAARATFNVPDDAGRTWTLEGDVVRWTVIRRAGAERQRRPVVSLVLCLAGLTAPAEFTLTDRTGQDTRVLIGRAALAGRFLVAADLKDTRPEACAR